MGMKEATDKLADLYSLTGVDWVLNIHHIVTEPVCPTASLGPEGKAPQFEVHGDTIEEAVIAVCDLAYKEIIQGAKS